MNMCSQISKLWVHGYNEFLSTTCLCVNGFVSSSTLGLKNMAIISRVVYMVIKAIITMYYVLAKTLIIKVHQQDMWRHVVLGI
jgi:hypothetical protein